MPKSHVYLAALAHFAPNEIKKEISYQKEYDALIERAAELVLGEKPVPVKEHQLLASVFEEILTDNHTPSFFYQPTPFSLGENDFFPEPQAELKAREETLKDLAAEISKLHNTDDPQYAENILALYKKYTPKIHCGFEGHPTISFYDFAKSLAGIAVSLYEGEAENRNAPLLLIGGDLSGIQDFIYDIVSKTAAKNLKGRSFYLQLLIQ
ncbi:MAG: hypothetical protein KDC44_14705, partial [Phaeodactylibacter sp.]|nr:hypothetical protein [Phaeodactylibacter sp.]